jgi:hypothetical protein
MEIKSDKRGLPIVGCPVCKKNGSENDERYPPHELCMHLKGRVHKKRDLP